MTYTEQLHNELGGDTGFGKLFQPFIESEKFDNIILQLKERSKRGIRTAPEAKNKFRSFQMNRHNLKCIIVGTTPYAEWTQKGKGIIQASGLPFDCSTTKCIHIELDRLYDVWEGEKLDILQFRDWELQYLVDQGVMLYNISQTVEENKPGSDIQLWADFNAFFWTEIINKHYRGLPIVYLGAKAAQSEKYLTPMLHYPIMAPHPAVDTHKPYVTDAFNQVNEILHKNNGDHIMFSAQLPF